MAGKKLLKRGTGGQAMNNDLISRYGLDQHLEDQDCTKYDFMDSIVEYLREIGFDD